MNYRWVTDITYIITPQRTYYLCAIMGLCGRYMHTALALKSTQLLSATRLETHLRGKKERSLMDYYSHGDQGCQYTSEEYFALTQEPPLFGFNVQTRMPFHDNAIMENFFGTI